MNLYLSLVVPTLYTYMIQFTVNHKSFTLKMGRKKTNSQHCLNNLLNFLTFGNLRIQNFFVERCFFLQLLHIYSSEASNSSNSVKLERQSGKRKRIHVCSLTNNATLPNNFFRTINSYFTDYVQFINFVDRIFNSTPKSIL